MQYHYKGGGAGQPPPVGTNGNGAPISSPDSGIGDNHGNFSRPCFINLVVYQNPKNKNSVLEGFC